MFLNLEEKVNSMVWGILSSVPTLRHHLELAPKDREGANPIDFSSNLGLTSLAKHFDKHQLVQVWFLVLGCADVLCLCVSEPTFL